MLTRGRIGPQMHKRSRSALLDNRCDGPLNLADHSGSSKSAAGYGSAMPLRYVDPNRRRGRGRRVAESFGRSPVGQWFARYVSTRLDPLLYRATSGRFTTSMGVVVNAPLVTIGAKSGQPREAQLTTSMTATIRSSSPRISVAISTRLGTTT